VLIAAASKAVSATTTTTTSAISQRGSSQTGQTRTATSRRRVQLVGCTSISLAEPVSSFQSHQRDAWLLLRFVMIYGAERKDTATQRVWPNGLSTLSVHIGTRRSGSDAAKGHRKQPPTLPAPPRERTATCAPATGPEPRTPASPTRKDSHMRTGNRTRAPHPRQPLPERTATCAPATGPEPRTPASPYQKGQPHAHRQLDLSHAPLPAPTRKDSHMRTGN